MKAYQRPINIKIGLFIMAMAFIVLVFWVNRIMINELREDARKQVEFLAKSYSDAINSSDENDIRFVMDILLPSLNFPIIITSKKEISSGMNLNISSREGTEEYNERAWELVKQMDQDFTPLDLVWDSLKWGQIHYADPQVVTRLRWLPYLEISFGVVFLMLTLWGFQLIRKSEKSFIYAGMARETAHQLGTPVSSLMGWVKLLQDEKGEDNSIVVSMEEDVSRLSEISDRFSKIGSKPQLSQLVLGDLISEVIHYMETRLPKKTELKLSLEGDKTAAIPGDWVLMRWAVENLYKNAVDAMGRGEGEIKASISKSEEYINIDIRDTGKGIPRKDWKNIFRPGYSSKRRGWGLGLSLTQRIVGEIHGGNIKVLKSKPGETVFRLHFSL